MTSLYAFFRKNTQNSQAFLWPATRGDELEANIKRSQKNAGNL